MVRKVRKKRKYLPAGGRTRRKRRGNFLMRFLTSLLQGVANIFKRVVSATHRFGFWLITRIPYFRKLAKKKGKKGKLFWLNVAATVCLVAIIGGGLLMGILFVAFSKELPSPDRLINREISLSTKIYDRNGELLYDIYGDENRTLVTLDQVPEVMRQATVAIEDKNFYRHGGFDLFGFVRGAFRTVFLGRTQGGSTITQQLVKNALLTSERTLVRKMKELILSFQIEARFSKDEILQMYLNESPYGGQAIGIEAASEMYFGKSVSELTLAEAAMLAGLPQAPSRYSPRRDPELAKWRQGEVLRRMVEDGYVTQEEADEAKEVELVYIPEGAGIKAPHFVMYVRELLADRYGEAMVEHGGLRVTTSLDLGLHAAFQQVVTEEIGKYGAYKVSNGALVAIDPKTGEVLSMVGSADYFNDAIGGKFNVALAGRQPGSAIKPITYVTAFKQGYSPGTAIVDIPTSFDIGSGQPEYRPANFANKYNGLTSLRYTLGSSKNVPAVKVLSLVGINNMVATAQDMGITTFTDPSRIGLSVTLGGSEVKLLDLVSAFTCFATGGIKHTPVAVLKVTDHEGNVLEETRPDNGVRVLSEQESYLINNVLSDFNARVYTFGGGTQYGLHIPGHTVAVKTGTTHDNRDGWAVGYTPSHPDSPVSVAVGVWIGNNDNSEIAPNFFGGAASIWNRAMRVFLAGKPDVGFVRPEGVVSGTVDAISGMATGPFTGGDVRSDIFIAGTVPTTPDDWRQELEICVPDGKLASDACRTAGKAEKRIYVKIKAKDPAWQDDVDAWAATAYPINERPEYHPPTEVSSLCFSGDGVVVPCDKSNPLVEVVLLDEDGVALEEDNLSTTFEVQATAIPQPNTTIAYVEIYLADTDYYKKLTSATCGDLNFCYSYLFEDVPLGEYELRVYAVDTAGGDALEKIPINVGGDVEGDETEETGESGDEE